MGSHNGGQDLGMGQPGDGFPGLDVLVTPSPSAKGPQDAASISQSVPG